ncbi:MAG: hypothetical protein ACRDRX_28075 [Pseudonocardiaceae bacterium]
MLAAWNKSQNKNNIIPTPDEFRPKVTNLTTVKTKTFEGYDSDTEDKNMDIRASIRAAASDHVSLERGTGEKLSGVPVLPLHDAVRFGRQIVKRAPDLSGFQRNLPMVTTVGGKYIEYNSPGTRDIYAYPLAERAVGKRKRSDSPAATEPKPAQEPPEKRPRNLSRQGGMADHSWSGLAGQLEGEKDPKKEGHYKKTYEGIFGTFYGETPSETTPGVATSIAAIGSDLMKGTAGGMHHIATARAYLEEATKKGKEVPFKSMFTGTPPPYAPALQEGGRALVTKEHVRIKAEGKAQAAKDAIVLVEKPVAPELVVSADEKQEEAKNEQD